MKNSVICIVLWQAIFVTVCFANEFDPRFACDFSRDLCNWKNTNTSVMFKRNMGETGVDDTGPTAGHTDGSNTDYYIYLDTYGSPSYAGLVSPKMGSACVVACFRFWYHMYGQYVNRIEVGLNHDNHPLFNRSGDNGNMWKCATVPITSCNDKQIYIRAYESQEGIKSQIAFDDLALAYVDNKLQCSEKVCEVNGSDFTSSTIAMTSTTRTVSTLPVTSSTTLDFVPSSSGPPTTSTPTSLYLLSLLAVPFVVLAIGIVYIMKRKRNGKRNSGVNNISLNNNRHEHEGYSSDPTRYASRGLPDAPEEDVYLEILDDLKRPDDGGYINPVGRSADGDDYTDIPDKVTEDDMDNTGDQGYISAVDMADVKQSRDHDSDLPRALPSLPDMNSKAEKTPSSFPEVDYPDDEKDDYLHPVGKTHNIDHSKMSRTAENLSSGLDDDYLKPTRSVVIPSRFILTKEQSTQHHYDNQNTNDNMKRESSTTI